MERFLVAGGARLAGEVSVSGAKNSVLKLMAAALLAEGRTTLTAVPDILDVTIMARCCAGSAAPSSARTAPVTIDVPAEPSHEADYDLVRRIRASIAVLGPLVARCGEAKVALPGGDAIGSRGLDMHVSGLVKLGATVVSEHGYLIARAPRLTGAQVWLDFPSVGATENLLMAAALAKGATVIDNAAREPEIVDLCQMLCAMGAQIGGVGTSTLEVEGVESLSPVEHRTVPDRIVAGTWAVAATMTRGDVFVRGGRAEHLEMPLDKLVQAGAVVEPAPDGFRVRMEERPRAVDVVTLPYPGFATDFQPLFLGLNTIADGHRDDHRERLRVALDVRRRAGTARRRRAHRRQARRGRGSSSCPGAPVTGPRHPRRRRAWCSPAWSRTASPRSARCTTSTAATRASSTSWSPSARRAARERAGRALDAGLAADQVLRAHRVGRNTSTSTAPSAAPERVGVTVQRMPASASTARSISASSAVRTAATGTRRP
jgi:UDP-N-acetylglucosamine 1-carboxyvinyltransferase